MTVNRLNKPVQNTHERKKYDMRKNTWFKLGGAALLGLLLLRFAVPSGQGAPILTAVVQDQQCQGGDFVNVTLSATLSPSGAKRAVSVGLQQRRGL
jgi:hypothetical protein